MRNPNDDALLGLLRQKTAEAAREALTREGGASADRLDELNRLTRLVELQEKAFPARAARWRIAAVLASTLMLVSLLLFVHVRETEVDLEIVVSEVGFVLSRPQVLTEIGRLAELRASGLRDVRFSDSVLSQWRISSPAADHTAVRVVAVASAPTPGTVTLAPFGLPGGADIRVYAAQRDETSGIVLSHAPSSIRVTVDGFVRLVLPGLGTREFDAVTPKSILLETDAAEANLNLLFAQGSNAAFSPQLSVTQLALWRIDEFQGPQGTSAQTVSTILSGTLYLESLNGERRTLRPRDLLRFDKVHGVIRSLKLEDDRLSLQFRGSVRGMRSGWDENSIDLMPTCLAWLQARHGLSLLWGTTLYLFGLVTAVLRWWRVSL